MKIIQTETAPKAIGPYSQAIQVGKTVYFSGQIPLHPQTMQMASDIETQAKQAFANVQALAQAAGGTLADIVKITILLVDINDFPVVNQIMETFFKPPYPARATYAVKALPKEAKIEIEAIMVLE